MLLFLCGPHCSGKTTILKDFEARGLIGFRGSEIGKDLYYERRLDTAAQGVGFEEEVLDREIIRDLQIASSPLLAAVETWHPGNVAYAMVRNPSAVEQLVAKAKKSPLLQHARGVWLQLDRADIMARTRTFSDKAAWAADFYSQVQDAIPLALRRLGLADQITTIDARAALPDVTRDVEGWLKRVNGAA